jgi:hypothetical protein
MPLDTLSDLLECRGLATQPTPADAAALRKALNSLTGLDVYAASVTAVDGAVLAMAREGPDGRLIVLAAAGNAVLGRFAGQDRQVIIDGKKATLRICPTSPANAAALRKTLPFTAPTLVGLRTSVGLGDRLGLGTPGHVRAVEGTGLAPFFAQQSIREMTRTQRTAQQVMDDASFGVLQAGWRDGFGSDADHLKTTQDVDYTVAAGFTMFTIDPGEHVDNAAGKDSVSTLAAKYEALPWADLATTAQDCRRKYLTRLFQIEGHRRLADHRGGTAAGGVQVRPGDRPHGRARRVPRQGQGARVPTRSRCRSTRRIRRRRRSSISSWPAS